MTISPALTILRPTTIGATLAAQINQLLDEENVWDAAAGARFLADPGNLFLLAAWHGQPCGFLTAYRLQRFDQRLAEVFISEIGVDEAYQRRGIGAALIAACRVWATEVGAPELWVPAEAGDTPANAFYRATGGVPDAFLTRIYNYHALADEHPARAR